GSGMKRYDMNNRGRQHELMFDVVWDGAYREAWQSFYGLDHLRTILRRVAANPQGRPQTTLTTLLWFKLMTMFEGVHPLEGGAFRRKSRRDRRHGEVLESPLIFYPRYLRGIVGKAWRYWCVYRRCKAILTEGLAAPDRGTYTDLAIAPPGKDEFDTLDLYHATSGGAAALARRHREDMIRDKVARESAVRGQVTAQSIP